MSRAKQLADAEADAVEAESDGAPGADNEADPVPEVAPEPAADEGLSAEATLKAFEQEVTRHGEALREIMGDDYDAMQECITCQGLGLTPAQPFKHDPRYAECSYCDGHGFLKNPTRNPGTAVSECPVCTGTGYTAKPHEPAQTQGTQPQYAAPGAPGYEPPRPPDLPPMPDPVAPGYAPGYVPPPMPMPSGR